MINRGSHDSETLANTIRHLLTATYGCPISKVLCLVGDNAAVNPAAATKLEVNFFGCLSHKCNLIIKDILEDIKELQTIKNDRVNPTINYFRRSDIAKTNAFIEKTIKSYPKTRWYSYFESINSILVNKNKIVQYFQTYTSR